MEKKRILIIGDNFCLEAGGIQNTNYLLAKYMLPYMEVDSFCPADGDVMNIDGIRSYKSRYAYRPLKTRLLYLLNSIRVIAQKHREDKIDFILSTHYAHCFCAVFLKILYGIPYGVLTHGNEVYSKWPSMSLKRRVIWFLFDFVKRQIVLNNADQIYSNTAFTKSLVERVTSNMKITTIHPPIGLLPDGNEIIADEHYLLSVGRLVERKGYQNLINAMPMILSQYPNLKYIIAGKGPYENELKRLVDSLNLHDTVIFKGRVSEDEKTDLIEKCSVFVLPSFEIPKKQSVEGFGLSLLEANVYGKFVISTTSGGIPEAVEDEKTGFLVPEGSITELGDAIIRFLSPDFHYNPTYCKEWAKRCHITNIAILYYDSISKLIK